MQKPTDTQVTEQDAADAMAKAGIPPERVSMYLQNMRGIELPTKPAGASPTVMAALRVINAAWQHGTNYDLASQAAFALDDAGLLHTAETAAAMRSMEGDCISLSEKLDEANETIDALRKDVRDGEHWERAADRMRTRVAELEAAEKRVQNALTPRWDLAPDAQGVVETALVDLDHVHEYRDFGPHAGSRCVSCNQPEATS